MRIDHYFHFDPQILRLLHDRHRDLLVAIHQLGETLMADSASILAKVTANTNTLKGVAIIADTLNEGQTTIEALIADLKAQIAAGQTPPDFTPIDDALTEQAAVIDGMSAAIAAPAPPPTV